MLENSDTARAERLVPMGLTDGATLLRDVPIDAALTLDDVRLPDGLAARLWDEQAERFGLEPLAATSAGGR
jgi:predicted homoserine dehydrogenase-like protein